MWRVRVLFGPLEQVFVQQRGHPVQHPCALPTKRTRKLLDSFQGSATHEDREQAEEALFLFGEQLVAPRDRIAQGVLASRQIAWSTRQELQAVLQSVQQGWQGEQCEPGGG